MGGIVDERRTETAGRVARYKADSQGEPGYATRATNCYGYLEGALCFGLPLIFPWSLILLCLQIRIGVFFFFFFSSFFSGLCHIPWGGGRDIFSLFHSLSTILLCFGSSLFSSFLYFIECVCRACRFQYDVHGIALSTVLTADVAT